MHPNRVPLLQVVYGQSLILTRCVVSNSSKTIIIALLLFVAGICILLFNILAFAFMNPVIALIILAFVLVFLNLYKSLKKESRKYIMPYTLLGVVIAFFVVLLLIKYMTKWGCLFIIITTLLFWIVSAILANGGF